MREIKDKPNGDPIARLIDVMSLKCLQCQKIITNEEGRFLALDSPYNGVLHEDCAPYYNFPRKWPHEQPAQYYDPAFRKAMIF